MDAPTARGFRVSRNMPPILMSRIGDTSSRPSHRQYTHTPSGVSTREVSLREGRGPGCQLFAILARSKSRRAPSARIDLLEVPEQYFKSHNITTARSSEIPKIL